MKVEKTELTRDKAIHIRTDGSTREVVPANKETFSLEELQFLVGGLIEMVRLSDETFMFVNEEGRLDGLPLNDEATKLAYPVLEQTVMGDVVVVPSRMVE